jgi:hypothetical protein
LAEVKMTATLTVLLLNYSPASPGTLARTKEGVDGIFSKTGIRLAWVDCPPPTGSAEAQLCRNETAPGEIRVRIVNRPLKNYLPNTAFGFALPPLWATVYYEPVVRLASRSTDSESNVSVILSCLIAHEIGHLLLGPKAHTIDGIMAPWWEIGQIQQALRQDLSFTPQQSRLMLRNAQARTSTIDSAFSEQPAGLKPK